MTTTLRHLCVFGITAALGSALLIGVACSSSEPAPAPAAPTKAAPIKFGVGSSSSSGTSDIITCGYLVDAACTPAPEQPYFFVDGGPKVYFRATGDSITAGYNPLTGSPDPSHSWPQFMAYDLGTNVLLTDVGQLGWTSGQVLDAEAPAFGTHFTDGGLNLISLQAGTNDNHYDAQAPEMEANFSSFVAGAHAVGWLVLVTTVFPSHYLSGWTDNQNPIFNAWLLDGGSGADAVCDVQDLDLAMIERDGVHPYYSGHVRVGSRCAAAVRALLADAGAF